jgi:hypothetical protein
MKRQRPAEHPFFNFRNPRWKSTHTLPAWYKKVVWVTLIVLIGTLIWSIIPSSDDDEQEDTTVEEQAR